MGSHNPKQVVKVVVQVVPNLGVNSWLLQEDGTGPAIRLDVNPVLGKIGNDPFRQNEFPAMPTQERSFWFFDLVPPEKLKASRHELHGSLFVELHYAPNAIDLGNVFRDLKSGREIINAAKRLSDPAKRYFTFWLDQVNPLVAHVFRLAHSFSSQKIPHSKSIPFSG